jgi:hypothetical protein
MTSPLQRRSPTTYGPSHTQAEAVAAEELAKNLFHAILRAKLFFPVTDIVCYHVKERKVNRCR